MHGHAAQHTDQWPADQIADGNHPKAQQASQQHPGIDSVKIGMVIDGAADEADLQQPKTQLVP